MILELITIPKQFGGRFSKFKQKIISDASSVSSETDKSKNGELISQFKSESNSIEENSEFDSQLEGTG